MTGLCDAHVHVVDAPERRPMVAPRAYTPPPAPLADLAARARPQGIDRFVVVQPSFYGTDNTVTLEALRDLGGRGRGVAVSRASW